MSGIQNIITGHLKNITNKNNGLYQDRLRFCINCEHKGRILECDYCTKCNCPLSAKLREEREKCPIGLWDKVDKIKNN